MPPVVEEDPVVDEEPLEEEEDPAVDEEPLDEEEDPVLDELPLEEEDLAVDEEPLDEEKESFVTTDAVASLFPEVISRRLSSKWIPILMIWMTSKTIKQTVSQRWITSQGFPSFFRNA